MEYEIGCFGYFYLIAIDFTFIQRCMLCNSASTVGEI